MYDVKQVDPAEWSSPPWDAAIVDKPGFGKVLMGRGAVNQKGPEAAFLAALHAIRGAGKKLPVNLVLVAEGEEEIGSPHFPQVVNDPEVAAALKRTVGVFMPAARQDPDGNVSVSLGAKGVIELELVSSGEKWGRGPARTCTRQPRAPRQSRVPSRAGARRRSSTPTAIRRSTASADEARPATARAEEDARRGAERSRSRRRRQLLAREALGARQVVARVAGASSSRRP